MPTPVTETNEGGQHVEWSETFHAFLFRARIYLKRYWWIIVITTLAGVLVQVWSKRGQITYYVSNAEMMANGRANPGVANTAGYNENYMNYFETQAHLMKNQDLIKKTVERTVTFYPEYAANPPHVDASVNMLSNTSILQLSATCTDPKFAQYFLDNWMESFLDYKNEVKHQAIEDEQNALMSEALKFKSKVDQYESDKQAFKAANNLDTVDSELKSAGTRWQTIKDQLSDLGSQMDFLNTSEFISPKDDSGPGNVAPNQEKTSSNPPVIVDNASPPKESGNSPYELGVNVDETDRELTSHGLLNMDAAYDHDKAERLNAQVEFDELGGPDGLKPTHPKMIYLTELMTSLDTKLRAERHARALVLQDRKIGLATEITNLTEEGKKWEKTALEYSKLQNDYEDIANNLELNTNMYQKLVQGSQSLGTEQDIDQEILTINQHASVAGEKSGNPVGQLGAGVFVGLAGGIAIIFILGALDGRVMSVEDITQRFDEPMLGVIPMQKRVGGQVELLKNNDQRQMFAESCRNIRSSLLYMDKQGQRPRVIMLTSSMPSEGKSTLSANLAITLGFASSRTLLVDADMRRGQLHKRFNLKNDLGLAEHIKDGVALEKVVQSTEFENLDFIACGHYPTQPGELLMSDRFRESIEVLKQRYDFVIFDSPPILLTDDAASFATRTDAVLFVVRAGFTRMRQVRTSLESLHRRGANVYGMVVNFIDHREPGYYSYRYYDYYSYRPGRPN